MHHPRVCTPEQCAECDVSEDSPVCLERKAQYCMWLSKQPLGRPVRADLEQLAFDFMQAAQELRDRVRVATKDGMPSMWRQYLKSADSR